MSVHKKKSAPSPLHVLSSLLDSQNPEALGRLLPIAEAELPRVVARGLDTGEAFEAAQRIARRRGGNDYAKKRRILDEHPSVDVQTAALDTGIADADAAFALGLVAGMRQGGAR